MNEAIATVSKSVPARPTHPILGNILLKAEKDKVFLTGFDLAMGIRLSIPAEIEKPGAVTLPAKLFGEIVGRLDGNLALTVNPTKDSDSGAIAVTITSSSGRFQLHGLSDEEYPTLPEVTEGESINLAIASLVEGIKGTIFAASTDETKQVLTGVHLNNSDKALEFAATDGHRLAVVTIPHEDEKPETEFAVTIPAKALKEVERMASIKGEEEITLLADETQVMFAVGDRLIVSRKLDGAYPAYQQLIPRQFSRTACMERKRLQSGVERVSILSTKNNLVQFLVKEHEVTLFVEAQDLGNAKENLPSETTGEPLDIGFNCKYLLDGLKNFPSGEILMQFNESNQPVIFTPLGGLKLTYLVMPVQLVR